MMSGHAARLGRPARPELASVHTGSDWVRWLEQARPAQPFGIGGHIGWRRATAWAALARLAACEGFAAALGEAGAGEAFITWRDRRIHVRRDVAPDRAIAALAHQLAHVLLHGEAAYLDRSGTVECRGIRKLEADSVAYLVAAHLGIDTTAFVFADPRAWAGPRARRAQIMRAAGHRVAAAATQITRHLDAAAVDGTPGDPPAAWHAHPPGGGPSHNPAAGRGPVRTGRRISRPGTRRVPAAPGGFAAGARPDTPGTAVPHAQLVRVNQAAAQFFRGRLRTSWVPGYLAGRGFSTAIQERWQVGYAPAGWDTLTRHLRALGYPAAVIAAAGLARRSRRGTLIDTFRDRAMLPIRAGDGVIAAFIGRAPEHAGPQVPKYLNSTASGLYRKRQVLFGLAETRELLAHGAQPVLAEGPLDAIAVTAAGSGRLAGIAPCGTALTAEQAAALGRFCDLRATGVLVAFDPDHAGRNAAVAAYPLLCRHTDKLMAAVLPPGSDPAQILRDHGPDTLERLLTGRARPLADLVTDAEVDRWARWLRHAEGQFNALRAAAPLIAAMPPAHVARQVARLAHRLGLDYATITDAVTGAAD